MRRLIFVAMFVLGCGDNTEAPLDASVDETPDAGVDARVDAAPDAPPQGCTVASDCNDNNACTTDTCGATNVCVNTPKVTDDQIACTTDACDPSTGNVTHTPVNTMCEVDGKTCTVATCSATTGCSETPTMSVCDDGATCSTDACNPTASGADATTGCVNTLDNTACADTFSCTANTCAPSAVASDPTTGCLVVNDDSTCGDSIGCTTDACNPTGSGADAAGCTHQTNNAMCEVDGKSCTVATCSATTGCSETVTHSLCNDNATCSTDTCSATGPGPTGCEYLRNNGACTDSAECSIDECVPGATGADATTGCVFTADATVCNANATCSTAFDCLCSAGYTGDGLSCSGITCDALSNPTNGTVATTNGSLYPSTATYTCSTGFAAITSTTRTCNVDGTWTGAVPTCLPTFFVVRIGDGAAALTSTSVAVFVEERDAAGTLLRTIPLPTTADGSNAPFTVGGSFTTEGGLSRAANGAYVTLAGYATGPGTLTVNGTSNRATDASPVNRVVARVSAAGAVDTSTRLLDAFSQSSVRGASTVDGSAFWVSGNSGGSTGGVHYATLGSTGATTRVFTTVDNLRHTHVFGSQLYASSASGTALAMTRGVLAIGSGTPTTAGQAATQVAPFSAGITFTGFAVLDLDPNVAGVDTMYVGFDGGGASGIVNLQKWTFNGTSWTQMVFAPTATGTTLNTQGLTTWLDGTTVHIVVTTAEATTRILEIIDDGTTPAPAATVLATAAMNTAFRGVARSPTQ
jgi:hypothetical protein